MNDIKKLPKWAQEHIQTLQRERDTAISALNEYVDNQTTSRVYFDDWLSTGETKGPSVKRIYVQTHQLEIQHLDVHLSITLRDDGINMQWNGGKGREYTGEVAFIPTSFQCATLVAPDRMRKR